MRNDESKCPIHPFFGCKSGRRGLQRLYPMSTPVIIILVILALAAAAGTVVYVRTRPKPQEPIFHFNCPKCRRRLRFRLRQAGRQAACPRCRETFVFPDSPDRPGSS
jgi:hypothetical protein